MIDTILEKVRNNIGAELVEKTGMSPDQIPQALESVSSSVLRQAKEMIDSGNLMELKDVFLGGDDAEKEQIITDTKISISEGLQDDLNLSPTQAASFVDTSIPEIIKVSKEELLGPDGKFSLTDLPKIMSFFKSEGKEVKSGGLGGLFGF